MKRFCVSWACHYLLSPLDPRPKCPYVKGLLLVGCSSNHRRDWITCLPTSLHPRRQKQVLFSDKMVVFCTKPKLGVKVFRTPSCHQEWSGSSHPTLLCQVSCSRWWEPTSHSPRGGSSAGGCSCVRHCGRVLDLTFPGVLTLLQDPVPSWGGWAMLAYSTT